MFGEGRTEGQGTVSIVADNGSELVIANAHLSTSSPANVLSTKLIYSTAVPNFDTACLEFRDGSGDTIPFDAGYCAFYIEPHADNPSWPSIKSRLHPDAASAVLATGIMPITGTVRQIGDMPIEALAKLYGQRTAMGARAIKLLPETTDAPEKLSKMSPAPREQ